MKPKISLITLGVSDLNRSLTFYRDGLGFPTHEYKEDAGIVFFKLEGTWLALYPLADLAEDLGEAIEPTGSQDEQESKTLPFPRGGLGGVDVKGKGDQNLPLIPSLVRRGNFVAGVTLAHNVSTKEEVDAVVQLAVNAGAKLIKQPQEVFWGGYSGYFADPDGHLWEVAYNPFMDLT
jgi:uncharacterized protein